MKIHKSDYPILEELYKKFSKAWVNHRSGKPSELKLTSPEYQFLLTIIRTLKDD